MGHTKFDQPPDRPRFTRTSPGVRPRRIGALMCAVILPLQLAATRVGAPDPIGGAFGVRFGTPIAPAVVLMPTSAPALLLPPAIAAREPAARLAVPVRWRALRPPTIPPLLKYRSRPPLFSALLDDRNAPVRIVAAVPATDCSTLFKRINEVLEERYATGLPGERGRSGTPDVPPLQVIPPAGLLTRAQMTAPPKTASSEHPTPKIMLPGLQVGATGSGVAAGPTPIAPGATATINSAPQPPAASARPAPAYASIGPSNSLAAALKAHAPAVVRPPPPAAAPPARPPTAERAPNAVYSNAGNQVTLTCSGEQLFLDYIDGDGYAHWQRVQRDKVDNYDRAQRLALSNQLAPAADGVLDSAFGIRFGAPFKLPGALPDILAAIHPPKPFVGWSEATYEIMLDQSAVPIRVAAHATFTNPSTAYAEKARLVAALTERYGQPIKDTQRHSVISSAGRLAVVDLIGSTQVLVMFVDSDRLQIQRMRFEQRRVDLAAENERQRASERAGF